MHVKPKPTPGGATTFEQLHRATPGLSGPERRTVFEFLPEEVQAEMWKALAAQCEAERPDGDQ